MEPLSLSRLDEATRMLGEVRSVDDAVKIIDLAEAARVYARQIKLGLEAQNHAAEIKIRAQRRAGEILQEMEKPRGGEQYHSTGYSLQPVVETYADLGIEKRNAHVWQTLALMDAPVFEQFIARKREAVEEITTAGLYREARRFVAAQKPAAGPLPTGKYRLIYADPPWSYGDKMIIDGYKVSAELHYPVLSIDELCALPIEDMAEDNAVLFLWVTSPLLQESFEIIESWGFEYKASFIWDKIKHNYGHYNSVRHEFLLICTRGSCLPEVQELVDSVVSMERTAHSEKPPYFRELIDWLYPTGRAVELFARQAAGGRWETWGNEVQG